MPRSRRYGTVARPVRTNANMMVSPSPSGPVPWSYDADNGGNAVFWIGNSIEDGASPIGPHGPWPAYGATLPVVTRALSLLADPLTAGAFRVTGREEVPRWLVDPQLARPDARVGPSVIPAAHRMVRSVFWRSWIALAIGWGRSYLYFLEDGLGQPLAGSLRLINPALIGTDDEGRWTLGEEVTFSADGRWNNGRLVELRSPLHEQGVFLAHPEAFQLGHKVARYMAGTFKAGIPAGFLKVSAQNLTKAQADGLKQQWMEAHGGDARSIAVLSATVDFSPVSYSPVDAALGEVKRLNIADVAMAFNIAPETLGVTLGNSATYSSLESWFQAHRDYALSPWIAVVQDTLSALMPVGTDVLVNLDEFKKPVFGARMQGYQTALAAGILTINEVRAMEDLPPLPEKSSDAPVLVPGVPESGEVRNPGNPVSSTQEAGVEGGGAAAPPRKNVTQGGM